MVVLMLVVLSFTVVTGLFSGEKGGPSGLLLSLVAAPGGEGLGDVHEVFANLILILAVLHVCGVLADWWMTGENLVSAMISGSKELDETSASAEKPTASTRRMISCSRPCCRCRGPPFREDRFRRFGDSAGGAQ